MKKEDEDDERCNTQKKKRKGRKRCGGLAFLFLDFCLPQGKFMRESQQV
jgi:hypothetical protein